ncbi:trypsin-like peptidase domain-containing protein [Christensenellaceae bacterium OttesenSCG-928-M15]|nr:trypsin-like peptidase domain-containing protein [Christensenellaceae bacterium OttesenSCG-928-M15]
MEYDQYYDDWDGEGKPPKKNGPGRIFVSILAVILVIGVMGMLFNGLVQSARMPRQTAYQQQTPAPAATPGQDHAGGENATGPAVPIPTPFRTERPMIDLDGEALRLPTEGNPIPDLVDAVAQSVVGINNYAEPGKLSKGTKRERLQAQGSGFVVSSEGYVITNAHVVSDAYETSITLNDGTEVPATMLGADSDSDVAVLKVNHNGLKALKLGNSDELRVGDYVVAIGNALGWLEGSVTLGIVSASSRAVTIDSTTNFYIQTDAAINVGNSGGPLLNLKGEVIGVNTAKSISAGYDEFGAVITAEGLGFALPINKVLNIATQLITKGYVQRAALGVQIKAMDYEELQEMGLANGIRVASVVEGSPAENAGIKVGDIIVSCDGYTYKNHNELVEYIGAKELNARVEMELYRDGNYITVQVVLADKSGIDYSTAEPQTTPGYDFGDNIE